MPTRKTSLIGITFAGALVTVLLAVLLPGDDAPAAAPAVGARTEEGMASQAQRAAAAPRIPSGAVQSRVALRQHVELGDGAGRAELALQLDAVLLVGDPAPSDEERRVSLARLSRVRFDASADGEPSGTVAQRTAILEGLAKPFAIVADEQGRVVALQVVPGIDPIALGLLRTLASATQVVRGTGDAWTTEESDGTGTYRAAYRAAGPTLHKSKLEYTRLGGGAPDGIRVTGTAELTLDEQGRLERAVVRERTEVALGEGLPSTTSRLQIDLERLRRARGMLEPDVLLVEVPLEGTADLEAARHDEDRRRVGGASLRELLASLRAAGNDGRAEVEVRTRLASLLRIDPAAALDLEAWLLDAPGSEAAAVVASLGEAGTAEAQGALANVLESPEAPPDLRLQTAVTMGLVGAPTEEAVESLSRTVREAAGEVRAAAVLALGSGAAGVRGRNGELARRSIEQLVSEYRSTPTAEDRALLLRALGNAGDVGTLDLVAEALGDAAPLVRAAAALALRFMDAEAADALLDRTLLDDAEPEVRAAALEAMRFRDLSRHAQALPLVILRDPSAVLRAEAVRLAASLLGLGPVEQALRAAAGADPDETVREAAQAALASSLQQ